MFNEVLRIKPVLDEGTAKKMEASLSNRFQKIAKFFGSSLSKVIKGSVLGLSLGLLNKLLNPIEALEEKINNILGQSTNLEDLADQFNATPGEIKRLQDVAQAQGLSPDQFKDMLTKYGEAINTAREELKNPFGEVSARTLELKNFVGEEDIAKSFQTFLASLRDVSKGPGGIEALSDRAKRRVTESAMTGKPLTDEEIQDLLSRGEARRRTGAETRKAFEKEIFGQAQTGAAKRFINTDVEQAATGLNEPSTSKLNEAISRANDIAAQKRALEVQNSTQDFVNAANTINSKMIEQIAQSQKLQLERETKQLASFEDLKKASIAIDEIKGLFETAIVGINKGIGFLSEYSGFIGTLKNSRMFRGSGGKE